MMRALVDALGNQQITSILVEAVGYFAEGSWELDKETLTTLKERRVRGCLIQMYKVHNNLEIINWYRGPQYSNNPHEKRFELGNSLSLTQEYIKSTKINNFRHFTSVRYEFFTNSIVEHWNKLPNRVVTAPNLNVFKARLDAL